jgi:hypothetical protein
MLAVTGSVLVASDRSYSPITTASQPRPVGQRGGQGRGLQAARPGQRPAVAGVEELAPPGPERGRAGDRSRGGT